MADRGDTLYHIPTLNRWFLFASAFFTLTMVWTGLDDSSAEWKDYQREFRAMELEKAEEARAALAAEGLVEERDSLAEAVASAEAALTAEGSRLEELETAVYNAKDAFRNDETAYKSVVAELKWQIFNFEREASVKAPAEVEAQQQLIADLTTESETLGKQVEVAAGNRAEAEAALTAYRASVADAEKALAVASRDLKRVEEKIESLDPSDIATAVANQIRDFPGLDFIGPNLKVQKYVLDGIDLDLNFTKKPRIDMCTTCHMGMERAGFEDAPQPHTTHPRLDLFLSSKSPHPAKEFGCTACHRGSGESLSFQHVDHRPSDAAEEEAWADEYHWHKQHHWDYPMLSTQHTEAGCVQCHTTSMELIAEDAPVVTEGYRLVERHGCYACHKIEWFPTKRRPGPSLLQMKGKLAADWVESWIAHPRDYRPTTWMPQVFHLENYGHDEVVVQSNYGQGRDILGKEWNENAVAAVTEFLYANHEDTQFPDLPVQGNAERGREVMNLVGCYACHNTSPYEGEESLTDNLSEEPGRYNQHGPNLRGVNTKITKEWLFAWLKDPQAYWAETQMPNLRLSDRDAADITAYIMEDPDGVFGDTPDGWAPTRVAMDREVLEEQARWFFQKEGRAGLQAKLEGEWADDKALAVAVGKAYVSNQGCYSCHEIDGMQDMMPIGAELTKWASKTVDKLDFGLAYEHDAGQKQPKLPDNVMAKAVNQTEQTLPWLDHHYHDGWLKRKLAHPRSFDLGKVKNPKEKLRMPWFDFTDEEIDSIATFVLGLVNDDVTGKRWHPSDEELAADAGARAVRQKNCAACHVIDQPQITFEHEDGNQYTVAAEFLPLPDETMPPAIQSMEDFAQERSKWEEYWEEDLESVIVRLTDVHPDVGGPAETVEIPVDKLLAVTPSNGGDFVRQITSYYRGGVWVENPDHDPNDEESYPTDPWTWLVDEDGNPLVEDVDSVGRYYQETEYDKLRWTFAPPVLTGEGHKLQRDWFYSFLHDVYPLRQQMRVRMPSFWFSDGEAESIADYFAKKAQDEWGPRYARTARLALGREAREGADTGAPNGWDLPEDVHEWPLTSLVSPGGPGLSLEDAAVATGLSEAQVEAIESGYAPEVAANFARIHGWAQAEGFQMTGMVPDDYESILRRSASHLEEFAERIPVGEKVVAEGVNCFQCHPKPDGSFAQDPVAWAPSLTNVQYRLREEWVREWLWNPVAIYPGTSMPQNFAADDPQYQDQFPGSSNALQIDAVMDWLYNMGGSAPTQSTASVDLDSLADDQLLALLRARGLDVAAGSGGAPGPVEVIEVEEPAPAVEPEPVEEPAEEAAPEPPAPAEEPTAAPAPVAAAGAGSLSGRIVLDGDRPEVKALNIKSEQAAGCCADGESVDSTDRSLMVGASGGIANVVVTIEVDGATAPMPTEPILMDQAKCRFEPHVSVIPVGAKIAFGNSDSVSHNIHTYATKNGSLNKTVAAGGSLEMTAEKAEPIKVACDIHPWMLSWAYVTDATHWAVTDADGNFSIAGLPPGDYTVQLWHETLGKSKEKITVPEDGGATAEFKLSAGGGGGRRRRR